MNEQKYTKNKLLFAGLTIFCTIENIDGKIQKKIGSNWFSLVLYKINVTDKKIKCEKKVENKKKFSQRLKK